MASEIWQRAWLAERAIISWRQCPANTAALGQKGQYITDLEKSAQLSCFAVEASWLKSKANASTCWERYDQTVQDGDFTDPKRAPVTSKSPLWTAAKLPCKCSCVMLNSKNSSGTQHFHSGPRRCSPTPQRQFAPAVSVSLLLQLYRKYMAPKRLLVTRVHGVECH